MTSDRISELPPSLWAATAIDAPDCPALDSDEECDVTVIGAGYTGCSAAVHLAAAGKTVRVLEAAEPGWGCSGRNGGQVNPGGNRMLPEEVIDTLGAERGRHFIAMGDASCDLVFDLIERYQINCEAVRPGYVQGGWGNQGRRYQERWVRQWSDYGVECELLDRAGLCGLIGTDAYENGLYDPRGGNLQPLSYARGLARAALSEGAFIHSHSKAESIERHGQQWRVNVAGGNVLSAEHLLIATNGYTGDLWPDLARSIVPVCSFVAATEPLNHSMLATILPGKHAVSESCRVIVYYRLDQHGRFIIGGRGNWLNVSHTGDDTHVRTAAIRLFPQLADVAWDYHWAGWPAITRNHLPTIIALGPNAHAGLGYNGRGVASATIVGKQLSALVLGADPDLAAQPLKGYALHPFRQGGISFHLLSGSILDHLDRRGRTGEGR